MLNTKNEVSPIHAAPRPGNMAHVKRSRAVGIASLLLVMLGASMLFSGCIDDEKSFVIMSAIPPNDDCTMSINGYYVSEGLLDLNFYSAIGHPEIPPSYYGIFQLNNYFINTADKDSGLIDANRINLERFEVTYSWVKGEEIVQQPGNENLAFLAESPAMVVPVSGFIPSASAADKPGRLPVAGLIIAPDQGSVLLDIQSGEELSLVLGVHLKAFGTTAGGKAVESNEFVFPVYFCRGCHACPTDTTYIACLPGQDNFTCEEDSGN